jgi:hypothetical protein
MTDQDIIAYARQRCDGSDAQTMTVLARMLALAAGGVSTGFMRLPPERPASLRLDDKPPVT